MSQPDNGLKWIHVNDALPERDQHVLTWDSCDVEFAVYLSVRQGFRNYPDTLGDNYEGPDITHWAPMPDKPKHERAAG